MVNNVYWSCKQIILFFFIILEYGVDIYITSDTVSIMGYEMSKHPTTIAYIVYLNLW